ncbi:MAG: transporter [Desulfobulbus sp.]
MFSRKTWAGALAGCLAFSAALCSTGWGATSGSHYNYGVEGVLGATAPPPGWHYRMYNLWYNPDTLKDNNGNTVPGNFELDVFASVQRIIHVTNTKILGADYLYDVVVPLLDQDFTFGAFSDSHDFSIGDIEIEPFVLAWHQPRWDGVFGLAVILPTGHYEMTEPASPGLGYWSGRMTLGATYYFDEQKTWSASVITRTLINGEQEDTNITPGSELVAEYGVGKEFHMNNWMIRPGITGASYWQISDDSDECATADQRKQAHAIGAELNLFYLPMLFQVNLRYLQEYGVENGPEDSRFIATLTKSW